jgi:hypothetical protein
VHQCNRALQRRLHIRAAIETLAHHGQQRIEALQVGRQVALDDFIRATKGQQAAAAPGLVRRAQHLQHASLGHVLRRAAHRARRVQAHDHRPLAPRRRLGGRRQRTAFIRAWNPLRKHRLILVAQQL